MTYTVPFPDFVRLEYGHGPEIRMHIQTITHYNIVSPHAKIWFVTKFQSSCKIYSKR